MPLFSEIALALVLAVVFGFIAHSLKQPPIIGFILAGIAVGLFASPELATVDVIEGLAPIGVALLLFLVGLEMNMGDLRNVGWPSLIGGIAQVVITFGIGYLIVSAMGFAALPAAYLAIAMALSSTIIVIKLVSEKKELTSLYGRIAVGFLLVQDLIAILVLIFLSGVQGGHITLFNFFATMVRGGILVALTFYISRFFPRWLDWVGRSQEMLYLFSIAWALGVSLVTEAAGLSIEIGGFLAGLALANSSEHFQIGSKLRPVRDFFLILFFVGLGAKTLLVGASLLIWPTIVFSLFVLVGGPLIILVIMGALGFRARTSFLTAISLAQISEFSLILAMLGLRLGHLGPSEASLITLVGIITISASSYFIIYGDRVYRAFAPALKVFEFRRKFIEETPVGKEYKDHIVLIGVHRTGYSILQTLIKSGAEFVAVDFDPVLVKSLRNKNIPVVYGDIADEEIQEIINLRKAKAVISTVPNNKDNQAILSAVKEINKRAKIILTANEKEDVTQLYKNGANYVIQPHFVGGWELAQALGSKNNFSGLIKLQERDVRVLDLRGLGK